MNSMFTVIKFTFLNHIRTKSFIVITCIMAAIFTIASNLPAIIDMVKSNDTEVLKIGVFTEESPIVNKMIEAYKSERNPEISFVQLNSTGNLANHENIVKEKMKSGDIDGYLQFSPNSTSQFPDVTYKSQETVVSGKHDTMISILNSIKTSLDLELTGLTQEQVTRLKTPVNFSIAQISTDTDAVGKSESEMKIAYAFVYILLFLIYGTVLGSGNMVAMEVTAEKSSRVMEIMVASVSPVKQMFGKIIAVCLLGLMQNLLFIAVCFINLKLPHNKASLESLGLNINEIPISLLFYFVLFYICGYFIYAVLFAAVGSLVSRTEEVGPVILPVTFLNIAAFMIAMFGLSSPNATFIVIASFVPFFSPMIMFLRIGLTTPPTWEIGLSIAILIGSIIAIAWLAAKIYRTGVLLYGKRLSFGELRKAMRSIKVDH